MFSVLYDYMREIFLVMLVICEFLIDFLDFVFRSLEFFDVVLYYSMYLSFIVGWFIFDIVYFLVQ